MYQNKRTSLLILTFLILTVLLYIFGYTKITPTPITNISQSDDYQRELIEKEVEKKFHERFEGMKDLLEQQTQLINKHTLQTIKENVQIVKLIKEEEIVPKSEIQNDIRNIATIEERKKNPEVQTQKNRELSSERNVSKIPIIEAQTTSKASNEKLHSEIFKSIPFAHDKGSVGLFDRYGLPNYIPTYDNGPATKSVFEAAKENIAILPFTVSEDYFSDLINSKRRRELIDFINERVKEYNCVLSQEAKDFNWYHPQTSTQFLLMMSKIIKVTGRYNSTKDKDLFVKAIAANVDSFKESYRPSGKGYENHAFGMASILAYIGRPAETIAAGLVHSVYAFGKTEYYNEKQESVRAEEYSEIKKEVTKYVNFTAERLITTYQSFPALDWQRYSAVYPIWYILKQNNFKSVLQRESVIMHLANEVDEHQLFEEVFTGSKKRSVDRDLRTVRMTLDIAEMMGQPILKVMLERVFYENYCTNEVADMIPEEYRNGVNKNLKEHYKYENNIKLRKYKENPFSRYFMFWEGRQDITKFTDKQKKEVKEIIKM